MSGIWIPTRAPLYYVKAHFVKLFSRHPHFCISFPNYYLGNQTVDSTKCCQSFFPSLSRCRLKICKSLTRRFRRLKLSFLLRRYFDTSDELATALNAAIWTNRFSTSYVTTQRFASSCVAHCCHFSFRWGRRMRRCCKQSIWQSSICS